MMLKKLTSYLNLSLNFNLKNRYCRKRDCLPLRRTLCVFQNDSVKVIASPPIDSLTSPFGSSSRAYVVYFPDNNDLHCLKLSWNYNLEGRDEIAAYNTLKVKEVENILTVLHTFQLSSTIISATARREGAS